jgi:spermidine/putrescine transport system ATP-binding protein
VAASQPAIELVDASKRYGDVVALDGISLRIEPGEFFCLLGPSGCGKTTTLNLIGGFLPLSSGELRIEGRKVNDLPPHQRNVNTVFQNYALFPHMTVAQNVRFGLRMAGLPKTEIDARVEEYLDLVGLLGHADRSPSQLSGGQQQRVALARALAKRPAVLLLDEPLGALDLKLRHQMQFELARIHRQVGTTFVFVTHDQEEALSMSTRIAVMSGGRISQVGSPREVYYRPVDRFVADFIGESNFLSGVIRHEDGAPWFVLDGGERMPAPDGAEPGPATLMLRPESLRIGAPEGAPGSAITGHITGAAFMGNHTRVTVSTAAGALVVHRLHEGDAGANDPARPIDEEASVWWAPRDAIVMAGTERGVGDGSAV